MVDELPVDRPRGRITIRPYQPRDPEAPITETPGFGAYVPDGQVSDFNVEGLPNFNQYRSAPAPTFDGIGTEDVFSPSKYVNDFWYKGVAGLPQLWFDRAKSGGGIAKRTLMGEAQPGSPEWNEGVDNLLNLINLAGPPKAILGLPGVGMTGGKLPHPTISHNQSPRELSPMGFYSSLGEAIANSKQEVATADQWMGMIANTAGVKKEEIQWIGLPEFLKGAKKRPITKQEMLEHFEAAQVELQEKVFGGPVEPVKYREFVRGHETGNRDDRRLAFEAFHERSTGRPWRRFWRITDQGELPEDLDQLRFERMHGQNQPVIADNAHAYTHWRVINPRTGQEVGRFNAYDVDEAHQLWSSHYAGQARGRRFQVETQDRFPNEQGVYHFDPSSSWSTLTSAATLEEAQGYISSQIHGSNRPRHPGYVLPGGENYREFVLRWPRKSDLSMTDVIEKMSEKDKTKYLALDDAVKSKHDEAETYYRTHGIYNDIWHERSYESQQEIMEGLYKIRGEEAKAEAALSRFRAAQIKRLKDQFPAVYGRNYSHGHWSGVSAPMVHVRVTTRLDKDGGRSLFIEELQSDHHQQGREYGYDMTRAEKMRAKKDAKAAFAAANEAWRTKLREVIPPEIIERVKKDVDKYYNQSYSWNEATALQAAVDRIRNRALYDHGIDEEDSRIINQHARLAEEVPPLGLKFAEPRPLDAPPFKNAREEYDAWVKQFEKEATDRYNARESLAHLERRPRRYVHTNTVPKAPWRSSVDTLAFKRMLYQAAKEGYDSVTFSPGEVHVRRWYQSGETAAGQRKAYDEVMTKKLRELAKKEKLEVDETTLHDREGQVLYDMMPGGGDGLPRHSLRDTYKMERPENIHQDVTQAGETTIDNTPQPVKVIRVKLKPQDRGRIKEQGFPLFVTGVPFPVTGTSPVDYDPFDAKPVDHDPFVGAP